MQRRYRLLFALVGLAMLVRLVEALRSVTNAHSGDEA
jgi:hypothetical protein